MHDNRCMTATQNLPNGFRWIVTCRRGLAAATNCAEDAQFIADSLAEIGERDVRLIDTLSSES